MIKAVCPRICMFNRTGYCANEEIVKMISRLSDRKEEYINGCLEYEFDQERW